MAEQFKVERGGFAGHLLSHEDLDKITSGKILPKDGGHIANFPLKKSANELV